MKTEIIIIIVGFILLVGIVIISNSDKTTGPNVTLNITEETVLPFVEVAQDSVRHIPENECIDGHYVDCKYLSSMKLKALRDAGYTANLSRWENKNPDEPNHMMTVVYYNGTEYFLSNYGVIIPKERIEEEYNFISYNDVMDYTSWLKSC